MNNSHVVYRNHCRDVCLTAVRFFDFGAALGLLFLHEAHRARCCSLRRQCRGCDWLSGTPPKLTAHLLPLPLPLPFSIPLKGQKLQCMRFVKSASHVLKSSYSNSFRKMSTPAATIQSLDHLVLTVILHPKDNTMVSPKPRHEIRDLQLRFQSRYHAVFIDIWTAEDKPASVRKGNLTPPCHSQWPTMFHVSF